jgi:hypothetical protein
MTNSKLSRLLALSQAEYQSKRTAPTRARFKPQKVSLKLNADWDRQRGAAARLMASVLAEDSESLYRKVSTDAETASIYADAAGWLEREAVHLRKLSTRMDTAVARLHSALNRYRSVECATAAPVPPASPPPAQAGAQ